MTDLPEIFDPRHFAPVRQPLEQAATLPPFAYHDPVFYRREIDRVFLKSWNFVGHEDRVPEPGFYAAFDFAGIPIVLVRGRDGAVRAFANSCRHRGAKLVEGESRCQRIVCPYHGWTYGLDGALVGARGMDDVQDFRLQDNGLVPLRLEQLGKLMWVSFDPDGPSLDAHFGDLPGKLAAYGLDTLALVRRVEYQVACNWKIYVENFMDYYHTPVVHRASLARASVSSYHRDLPVVETGEGEYMLLYARHAGSAALLKDATGFPPLPTLSGRATEGSMYVCVFPCTLLGCTKDCVWYVEIHPTGPATIRIALGSCFHPETISRPDFDEVVQAYYKRWNVAVDEDNQVNELQQQGVTSPLARAGRVSPFEALGHTFENWLLDRLGL